jgi:hypothetical protein
MTSETPTIRLSDLAALMDGQERLEQHIDHLAALAVATDRLVNAVRALRDADGSKFRAIAGAESAVFSALTDYEAFIEGDEDAVALFHRLAIEEGDTTR